MRFSLMRQLATFDDFGHRPQLMYKGAESHQTSLGGVCSCVVKIMTLIMIFMAGKSLLLMEDPDIISFSRPMSKEERDALGPINFADYGF